MRGVTHISYACPQSTWLFLCQRSPTRLSHSQSPQSFPQGSLLECVSSIPAVKGSMQNIWKIKSYNWEYAPLPKDLQDFASAHSLSPSLPLTCWLCLFNTLYFSHTLYCIALCVLSPLTLFLARGISPSPLVRPPMTFIEHELNWF